MLPFMVKWWTIWELQIKFNGQDKSTYLKKTGLLIKQLQERLVSQTG